MTRDSSSPDARKPPRIPNAAKYLPSGIKRLLPAGMKGLPMGVVDPMRNGKRRSLIYTGELPLDGWILLDDVEAPVRGRVSAGDDCLLEFEFNVDRPDVSELFGAPAAVSRCGFNVRVPMRGLRGDVTLRIEAWNARGTTHTFFFDAQVFEPSASEALAGQIGDLTDLQKPDADSALLSRVLPCAKLEVPLSIEARHDDCIEIVGWCMRDLAALGEAERRKASSRSATDRSGSDLDAAFGSSGAHGAGPLDAALGESRGQVRLIDAQGGEVAVAELEEERGWMGAGRLDLRRQFPRVEGAQHAGFRGLLPTMELRGAARLEVALPVPGRDHLFIEQEITIRDWQSQDDEERRRAALDDLKDATWLPKLLPLGKLDTDGELLARHDDTVLLTGWCLIDGADGPQAPERLAVSIDGQRVGTLVGGLEREDLAENPGVGDLWRTAGFGGRVATGGNRGRFVLRIEAEDPALADPSFWPRDFGPAGPPPAWSTEVKVDLSDDTPAEWNRQRVREFDPHAPTPGRQLIAHYPMQLFVEFTTACQLSCLMCRHGSKVKDVPLNQYLGDEHVRALIEVLPHLKALNMFGWGEATLHPRYCEFLRDARILNPHLEIAVTSHFNVVTDELVQTLVQAAVTSITISVDGASQDVYEFIRRRAHFEAVTENIKRLVAAKKEANSELPHIVCEFVVQRANIAELEDYVEYVHGLGVRDILLEPVASKTELVPDYGVHLTTYARAKAPAAELGVKLRGLGCQRFEAYTEGWEEADFAVSSYSDSSLTAMTLEAFVAERGTQESGAPLEIPEQSQESAGEAIVALLATGAIGDEAAEFVAPPEASDAPLVDYAALSGGAAARSSPAVPVVPEGGDALEPLPPPPKGESHDIVCYEPFQTAYINADGTITPCCWSSRVLGRMSESSPEGIWLGEAAAALRAEILANDLDPICKRCVAMGRAAGRVDT